MQDLQNEAVLTRLSGTRRTQGIFVPQIIRLPQLPWHGTKELEVPLPDTWEVTVCNMAGWNRPALSDDQIKASLTYLMGSPPIRELAKGKEEVVILFDDMARVTRVARIVPFILEELAEAGIPDHKIRFVAATGTHGAMNRADFAKKLGEETLKRFPVYNHNTFDHCSYVGKTSYGTPVSINSEVLNCDFKIAIGSVTPHPLTVFSGGGKNILPGVASFETIKTNHRLTSGKEPSDYAKNVPRLDMEEAARLVGLDVLVECLVNSWGETCALFAGDLTSAHEAAVREAKTHYLTPKAQDQDIVIANTFAEVNEAAKGLLVAFPSVSERGGDVVLIRNAPEGQVIHYLFSKFGRHLENSAGRTFVLPSLIRHLILYSEYPDIAGAGHFGESDKVLLKNTWADVLDILQKSHGRGARVAVYPNADIQYFG